MIGKYFDGKLPAPGQASPEDAALIQLAQSLPGRVDAQMEELHIPDALGEIWKLVNASNKYIDVTAPWILAKTPQGKERLSTVLYNLAECLRIVAILLKPFLTATPARMLAQLGVPEALATLERVAWGGSVPGAAVQKGEALFPRIDVEKELALLEEAAAKRKAAAEAQAPSPAGEQPAQPEGPLPEIDYADFEKLDLRLAKVVACEEIKRSKKLLKLTLEVGSETRTVVSGIKSWYAPEDLLGKTVVLVANLKPVTLCGVESRGMILCASDDGDQLLSALTTLAPMASGLKVR